MINGHRYDFTDDLDWRKARCGVFLLTCINIFACCCSAGGGEAGAGRRLWLLHREAVSDGAELHTAAHPHPALHL